MNKLREAIIESAFLHSDEVDAILDALIEALPRGYSKPIHDYPITEAFKKGYTEAVEDVQQLLLDAKENK